MNQVLQWFGSLTDVCWLSRIVNWVKMHDWVEIYAKFRQVSQCCFSLLTLSELTLLRGWSLSSFTEGSFQIEYHGIILVYYWEELFYTSWNMLSNYLRWHKTRSQGGSWRLKRPQNFYFLLRFVRRPRNKLSYKFPPLTVNTLRMWKGITILEKEGKTIGKSENSISLAILAEIRAPLRSIPSKIW